MMIPTNKSVTPIAKLITCQPLADHDGAAIFAAEIITFERQTGILLKRTVIQPDLDAQIDVERSVDMGTLANVISGISLQHYLNSVQPSGVPTGIQAIIPILTQEIFGDNSDAMLFWWNSIRSYPVLRAFYLQNNDQVDTTFDLDPVIDVRSFIGTKKIGRLDDNEQVYTVLNWIAQRFMPETPQQVNVPSTNPTHFVTGMQHVGGNS